MASLSRFGVDVRSFFEKLKNDETYKSQVRKTDKESISEIETLMAHTFRYYQREALAVFDFFYNVDRQSYAFKDEIFEREFGDGSIPFYGFEMATGSGKTLLIGALMIYLFRMGYRNFLVITPGTEIYSKTIRNFDVTNRKCVFSKYIDIEFNVVTGDNFVDKSSNYQRDRDMSIFVFNIQKFFDRETGTLRVDKEWEESYWRDRLGNTISFRDYLKSQKLAIITDEAHHYQNFRVGRGRRSSGDIILSLMPELVLEFTATAIVNDDVRRTQKVIYNYPINTFIDDGYGKKVRAYGYAGSPVKAETAEVTQDDKKKFVAAYMIHLVKTSALEKERLKPILLIRARNIDHADNLLRVIQEELPEDTDLIRNTYEEITTGEKFEITELIRRYVSLDDLKESILTLPHRSFAYHSRNEDDEAVRTKVDSIETNEQEVLIQIKKLEEGWDIRNPYTILILSLNPGKMKTYVKQFIGRGVRLFREVRKYDDLTNFLDKQQEILHVVCDKGSNFERFISEVRDEMQLSRNGLEIECTEEEIKNPILPEFEEYSDLTLPVVQISSAYPETVPQLLERLSFEGLSLDLWLEKCTKSQRGEVLWIWDEEEIGIEKDITEDIDLRRGEPDYEVESFALESGEIERLVRRIVATQTLLPSHISIKQKFKQAISTINKKNIKFKRRSKSSRDFYETRIANSLRSHISDVINDYFETQRKLRTDGLKLVFQETSVVLKKSPGKSRIDNRKRARDVSVTRDHIPGLLIYDFSRAYYQYNSFDSSHEFKLAHQLDGMEDVEFWIRNKRSYSLEYGIGNRYYPDFVVKHGSDLYIIEVKGTGYLQSTRTEKEIGILRELRSKGYKTLFLLDETIDTKVFRVAQGFRDVINNDDLDRL